MRYFVQFSYRGTEYHGSQTQPNARTVQQTLETALSTILRTPTALVLAGRTDAGVHAQQMWAHMDTDLAISENRLAHQLNGLLPDSIAVQQIAAVRPDAHARYTATQRTYEYRITTEKDVFATDLRARVAPGLDYGAMNEAARLLLGRHDFASFCRVHTDVKTTYCTITRAEWDANGVFTIAADRFLRNMVRAVVGTLFMVGRGQLTAEQFQQIIDSHDRCAAGQSAPAAGLYLVRVDYPEEIFV